MIQYTLLVQVRENKYTDSIHMERDCVFCKIVAGKIPSYKIYEDADFMAFMDIEAVSPGHLLLIPKKHYRYVWDVPEFGKYWEVAKKITPAILKALDADRVHYITLGESVPHAHIHIVPRKDNDGLGALPDWTKAKPVSDEQLMETADKIKKEL